MRGKYQSTTNNVTVQHHRGCRVTTAATAIPALADGQFWPSPFSGACRTGAMCERGGRAGMPLFDAISIASVMVLECFVCDERSGLSRVYVKSRVVPQLGILVWYRLVFSRYFPNQYQRKTRSGRFGVLYIWREPLFSLKGMLLPPF